MITNRCRYCGRFFGGKRESTVCDNCRDVDMKLFDRIEDYLLQFPLSNALEISEGLEISAQDILHFIDEGRLQVVRGKFERLGEESGTPEGEPEQK